MLTDRGYDTSTYDNFTLNDISNMLNNYTKNKDIPEPGSLDIFAVQM